MNCKHCGYPINHGQKVCPSCGKPVKWKKGLKIFLEILLALVLIVCAGLSYRTIGNFFAKRGSSAEEYYQTVEKKNVSDLFRLASLAGKKSDKAEAEAKPQHMQAEAQLVLGEAAQQFLAELNTGAIKLGWIQDLGLRADLRMDGLVGADVGVTLNQTPLMSLDAVIDPENGEAALLIPELTENYLRLSAADLPADEEDEDEVSISLGAILGSLPPTAECKELVLSYVSQIVDNFHDVQQGEDSLTLGEISRSYTTLTVRVDAETAKTVAVAVCERLRDDAEVRRILTDASSEEAYASFREDLSRAAAAIAQNGLYDGELLMTLYVDASGTICARRLALEEADAALTLGFTHQGGRYGLLLSREDAEGALALAGGGKLHGLTLDGSFALSRDGAALAAADMTAVLKGVIKGEAALTVRPESALLQSLDLPVEAEAFGKELSLALRCDNLSGGVNASAELFQATDPVVSFLFTLRSADPAETPVMQEGLPLAEWRGALKMPGLLGSGSFGTIFDNLKAAGMPGELITGMKLLLPTLLK